MIEDLKRQYSLSREFEEKNNLMSEENYEEFCKLRNQNANIDIFGTLLYHIATQEKKLAEAVECLKFYGDHTNWNLCYRPDIKKLVPANTEGTSVIEEDIGKRARNFLSKITEPQPLEQEEDKS